MIICAIIIVVLVIVILVLCKKLSDAKQMTRQVMSQLEFLEHEYVSLVLIDLKDDTYSSIKVSEQVERLMQSVNTQANFQLQTVMKNTASEDFHKELLEFVDLTTVEERLKGHDVISFDFKGRYNGWCRSSFRWGNEDKKTVLYMVRQIDSDKIIENELRYQLENDSLTGLRNESYGIKDIIKKLDAKVAGMFCVIEMDGFKTLNDKYGNATGDEIIFEVAKCIKESFKETDVMVRRGGARFAVFSVGINDKEDGRFIMKMLENKITEISVVEENISISVGVVFNRPNENNTYETLLENAESCLKTSRELDGVSVAYFD